MSGFSNPIIGGSGQIVRNLMKSPNFIANTAGWIIRKDGSAQFNNVSLLGSLLVGVAPNPQVNIFSNSGQGTIQFPSNIANSTPAQINLSAISGGVYGSLLIQGPSSIVAGQNDSFSIEIDSFTGGGTVSARLLISYGGFGQLLADYSGITIKAGNIAATDPTVALAVGTSPTPETWKAITLPGGLSGTARCKKLAESTLVKFDFEVTWTATVATTFNLGNLPSAAYYPKTARQIPMGWNGTPTGASSAPRIFIPVSGAVQILVPASSGGGSGGNSFDLPTD